MANANSLSTLEALARPSDRLAAPKQATQKPAAAPSALKVVIPQAKANKGKKKSKKSDMTSVLSGT